MGDKSSGEGPPPPSPLTGAYLLIVLPQTHQLQHKDYVLHNLTKGLLTWDKTDCHVDLEKELQTITAQAPEGEEAKNGERLIQFASENLVTEVLIHPQLNTLVQCMRNLLSSFTRHRHIIHAGYTCAGNGAWMLQDGTYSYADFAEMYQEHEVQRVLRAYENTVTVDVHCLQEGDWNNLKGKDPFSKVSRVRLNPKDLVTSTPAIKGFLDFLSPYVTNGSIDELLESSDVVGNIRFSHPTLYVFPGGQGDAALFGINGFNMLVDGGFARKACFWDFSRHLDRLDAVLMTRLNNGNIQGMTSLLQRKRMDHVYPQIGHFFCNMQERRHPLSPDGDKDRDPLLVSLFDQGQDILGSLRHLQLKPQPCYRDPVLEPVNLYHKVGHGKLDMYVISPAKDSREVREFMAKWTTQDSKIFCSFTKRGGEFNFPLCNKVSICVLLVWQPANPEDNITRLLFPGSTPQHKIFEGLDKLKNLEFMKHAVCSARTLSPSSSSVGLNVRTVSKPKVPASVEKIIDNDEKKIEAVKQPIIKPPTGQTEKQPPKSQPPSRPPSKQKPAEKPREKPKTEVEVKTEKTETAKPEKAKPDKIEKTEAVQKIDKSREKPKRPITKQPEKKKPIGGEKKDSLKSSPTTPKKIAENKVSEVQSKPEVKSRASSRTKPSPSATPAKSAKEANNRKVFEQKKEATKRIPPSKKEEPKKAERSTAPRKSVPSPSKTDKQQVSPVKGPRPVIKPKQDTKKISKPEKDGVTDSVASTPSTVDVELAKAKEDLAEKEIKTDEIKVGEAETAEQPSLSKDEEDEILVIEKIEIEGDGKDKPEESIAVHIRNSREDIIADEEVVKDEAHVDLPSDEKKEIMKTSDITIPDTDSKQFSEDVQDITKDAPDTSKSRVEFMTTEEASITKEPATDKLTPREKDGKEKSTDIGDIKQTDESQPDEKFSTTVESGATTAPTLPEDERIPLDEIKEIIEEKYINEETKEKDIVAHRPEQPTSLPEVPVISSTPFDQRVQLLKDIVKTPDEVADLPVHEEADGGIFAVDETQLARDIQKNRDDLLGIPAPKKTAEKKEDAAEEVKLVKDENEKEDATKDLKEDDIALDEKDASSVVPPVEHIDHPTVDEEEILKPDTSSRKPDGIEPAPEKGEVELIDNEAAKSSAIPASLEDDEILDEDKDKETEKEKLIPKESRDLDKDEDIVEKANKEMINEKQVAKSVVEEEIKEKKPVPEDVSPEEDKTEAVQESDKQSTIEPIELKKEQSELPSVVDEVKDDIGQVTSDKNDELTKPEDGTKVDQKSKSPSPEPLGTVAVSPKPESKDSKSPSPLPKDDKLVTQEPEAKLSKSPSPEVIGDGIDTETEVKASKSPSPEPMIEQAKDIEEAVKASKSPSPEPKVEESKVSEAVVKAPKSPSPEPKAEQAVDAETVLKAPKSPSPEPTAKEDKDTEAIIKVSKSPSPEPKIEQAKDIGEAVKASKSPSPEPEAKETKVSDAVVKSSKSPSPEPEAEKAKDVEDTVKASKSPSPEPKVEEIRIIEAAVIAPKSPSPEPKAEEVKGLETVTKTYETISPEPKTEEAKEKEAIAKSPSPEPKVDESKDDVAAVKESKSPEPKSDDAKDIEAIAKASKLSTPEPRGEEAKNTEGLTEPSKTPEPKVDDSKDTEEKASVPTPSPEPKADQLNDVEAIVKASKTPSPEPKVEGLATDASTESPKSVSPDPKAKEAADIDTLTEAPMSSSPDLKDVDKVAKASKSPSPEPMVTKDKNIEAISKSPKSPEPKDTEAKDNETISIVPKSPEPKDSEVKDSDTPIKISKSPSPEPKAAEIDDIKASRKSSKSPDSKGEEATDIETIDKASKTPSPEHKADETLDSGAIAKVSKSPSPEPEVEQAKDLEVITKVSKSPSPEPMADEPKGIEGATKVPKSPSPELKEDQAKDIEALARSPKSSSPEPKPEESKDIDVDIKASKSPSPVHRADEEKTEYKMTETTGKLSSVPPSPEPAVDTKDTDSQVKVSKSPSPEEKVGEKLDEAAKISKSPSPEPKVEQLPSKSPLPEPETEGTTTEELTAKVSKTPSPELKEKELKSSDIPKLSKSPTPEPKAEETVGDSLAKTSIPSSPEPKAEDSKPKEPSPQLSKSPAPAPAAEPELAKSPSPEPKTKSKTPSPEPAVVKSLVPEAPVSKSPSPEPKTELAKELEPITKVSKSPSPEPGLEKPGETLGEVSMSSLPEPTAQQAASPLPEVTQLDEVYTKQSKSPSPEPITEMAKSPEPVAKASESSSQDEKGLAGQEAATPSPEPVGLASKSPDLQTEASKTPEPKAKSPDSSDRISKSPEPNADAKKDSIGTMDSKVGDSEPSTEAVESPEPKELSKSLEPQIQQSKSPSPEPLTKVSKSPQPSDEQSVQPQQEEEILKSEEPREKISKSATPEPQSDAAMIQEASAKASTLLDSQPDLSKSPSPEPQMKDSKSPSPVPLESLVKDGEKSSKTAGPSADLSDNKEDETKKKVKTKEELNQELIEEKEVDEVTEPEKKDQKNLLTKLDGVQPLTTPESKIDGFVDSKAESPKLEAEKHSKEINLENDLDLKHETSGEKKQISGSPAATEEVETSIVSVEKQVVDEKEIDQSSTKKLEEFKEKVEEKTLEKPIDKTKLGGTDLSTGTFKADDRVPSISLREASIEQTSEESGPPKLAEIDKGPSDSERDITSASLDRKPSSGEISTKSTDGDEKSISEIDRKLSGTGSIGSAKSGEVSPKDADKSETKVDIIEEAVSRIESSVDETPLSKDGIEAEKGDKPGLSEPNKEQVEKLEKSIADDRDKLETLVANEEPSAQGELEKSLSGPSKGEAKIEEIKDEPSLPESTKLEAEKDSVEVRSKDELKDEALVLDLDLPEKPETTAGDVEKPEKAENVLKEAVPPSSPELRLIPDEKLAEGAIDKKIVSASPEKPKQKLHEELQGSTIASEPTRVESATKDLAAESLAGEKGLASLEPVQDDTKSETKDGEQDVEKHSSKSPSPPTVLDVVTKEDGKISPGIEAEDKQSIEKDKAMKPQEKLSPETSPVMEKKIESLTKVGDELKSTSLTAEPPTIDASHETTLVSSDVKVGDSKVESSVEKKLDLTDVTLPTEKDAIASSEKELVMKGVSIILSDKSEGGASTVERMTVESGKAADEEKCEISDITSSIETVAGEVKGSLESKVSEGIDISSTTVSVEPTKAVDGKDTVEDASLDKSVQEKTSSKTEALEQTKDTTTSTVTKEDTSVGKIPLEPSDITSKDASKSASAITEQLHFATSIVDSKHSLESIEPLVTDDSRTAPITAKTVTETDAEEITTATLASTKEPSPAVKSLADEIPVVKPATVSLGSAKDSIIHSSLLTNGKTASDIIYETDEKVMKLTADGKEHDAKKSDIRVTDILDTAERIVSSLNGKKTISDEPCDYIPSFSETKSYSLTIEGKKGPSDEITVETKTIEEGDVLQAETHTGEKEAPSTVSKPTDELVKDVEKKSAEILSGTTSSEDMNGHCKLDKKDEHKMGTITTSGEIKSSVETDVALSTAPKSGIQEKTDQAPISTSSADKADESVPKPVAVKEDSTLRTGDKSETDKVKETTESVGQALTKVISETATTISETVSAISSIVPSDLLKSSASSTKGSTTASPDLSRKSDDPISTTQQDGAKEKLEPKLHLASKDSLIDVTSSFLSMESGVSQGSEKSVDISGSSSKSGEKITETTDKKSSPSSTQVEPPTEKDQPLLHSATAALKTQKEFSRSETPASDILSDRDIEIGHCTPYSDTSSGQVSRAVTHVWETVEGRPESRHYDSDEDIPGSPTSISSHIPSPPQFEYDISRSQDPMMMSSFYGSLPGDFDEGKSSYDYGIHDKGDVSLKKELGGDKVISSIRSSLTSTPESSPLPERRFESLLATSSKEPSVAQPAVPPPAQPSSVLPSSSSLPSKPDPIEKWDKPLGLPPPHSTDSSTPYLRWNPYKEWGKPLGLPSPAPPPREDTDVEVDTSGSPRTTPKKVSKMNAENNKYSSNAAKEASNKSKRSESPVKKATGKDRKSGPTPVYMDLSYVPHHGNSNYATVEFFKRVRARYYVFSGTEPSKEVFNALLEAKQSWEDKDLEVTIIPTYDTDTLGYWIAENEETLSKLKIDLSPSASRCTINLQDHDTSCSAYRLEF